MSTFAELAALQTPGVAWLLKASSDGFVTTPYQFGTVAGALDGSVMCDPRIKKIGNLRRGLGSNHSVTASMIEIALNNIDGGADWLCDQSSFATVFKTRFKLYCYLYDPQNPSNYATKLLGVFACSDQPRRTADAVVLSLSDAALSDLASLARTPSLNDWLAITDANRPATLSNPSEVGAVPGLNYDTPMPLLFGTGWLPMVRVHKNAYVICAVRGSAGALAMGVASIATGDGRSIPEVAGINNSAVTIWTVRRTPDITVDGKVFHLLWVNIDLTGGAGDLFIKRIMTDEQFDAASKLDDPYQIHELVGPLSVQGFLFSQTLNAISAVTQPVNAATIARDIAENYSSGLAAADVAGLTFSALALARPDATASGVMTPTTRETLTPERELIVELTGGEVLPTLKSLADLGDFDLFFSWDGKLTCTAHLSDFATLTAGVSTLDETLLLGIAERIPSVGERWAPFNQLCVRTSDGLYGPFSDAAAILAWGRVVERTIDATWMQARTRWSGVGGDLRTYYVPDLWRFRPRLKGIVRPCLTVSTWLNGFDYEIGSYLTLAWSRGLLGTPYESGTVWRVEGITVNCDSASIELELVWVNDLTSSSSLPYLLDTEALLTRATGSGARTCTLTTGSSTIAFSSGSLSTDGVAAGDMVVIQDATEAATGFYRQRVVRVASITDTTHLVYTGSTDWSTGGPFTLETWKIQRGALTYPTSGGDYPSGGTMYGKVSDSTQATFFSNGSTKANLLEAG